jgi:hypothetical protein
MLIGLASPPLKLPVLASYASPLSLIKSTSVLFLIPSS